jgi:iron(II)-dependent oxidoreductase
MYAALFLSGETRLKRIVLNLVLFTLLVAMGGCSEEEAEQPEPPQGMVLIPAGHFQMGSEEGDVDEAPIHTVYLDAFYIDKYEVTNAQYRKFVEATGHPAPRGTGYTAVYDVLDRDDYQPWNDPGFNQPNHPITNVTWSDAIAYCEWLGKRLPTEAEWEKAARSGIEGAKYTWGNSDPNNRTANFADSNTRFEWRSQEINDSFLFVAPVGSFQPNGYGLFDMAGNLWEWCSDWYGASYYAESPRENPKGPPTGERRVLRSGAWYRALHTIRSAERVSDYPDSNLNVIGFRCAMDAP